MVNSDFGDESDGEKGQISFWKGLQDWTQDNTVWTMHSGNILRVIKSRESSFGGKKGTLNINQGP